MKKILIPIVLCLAGLFASSCSEELLEIPQKGVVSIDSFYQTDEDALSARTAMYDGFERNMCTVGPVLGQKIYTPYMFALNLPGDDVYAACKEYGNNDFEAELTEFRYDPSNYIISSLYSVCYQAIYYCNLITDHFAYGESAIKDKVISEARVLRAFLHMTLAIYWGTPPLVDHVLLGSDKPGNFEGGQKALLEWCAKECGEAAAYLDERKSINDKNGSFYATKGLAWTVQGKSLIFAGDYQGAKTALKKVIDSGKYALVPGERWSENFHVEGDGNEEKVFEANVAFNPNVSSFTIMYSYSTWQQMSMWCWRGDRFARVPREVGAAKNGWGGLGVNVDFAKEFIENDGDSPRRKGTMLSYDEVLYELNYTQDVDADSCTYPDGTVGPKTRDPQRGVNDLRGVYGNGEYLQYKRIVSPKDVEGHSSYSEANYIFFRYAEVLLMYAECCARVGDTDGSGLKALNDIQIRAGGKAPVTALTLENVKREKKFELWTEGCRFADCLRWGDLEGMKKAGSDMPTLLDSFFFAENPTPEHHAVVNMHNFNDDPMYGNGKEHGFKPGKHELFPFPDLETSINPNIIQNPGWGSTSTSAE